MLNMALPELTHNCIFSAFQFVKMWFRVTHTLTPLTKLQNSIKKTLCTVHLLLIKLRVLIALKP